MCTHRSSSLARSARGQAFGTLWLTISLGGMLGALYATNTAAHDPFGIEGWRFVFFSVACVRCGRCVCWWQQAGHARSLCCLFHARLLCAGSLCSEAWPA